MTKSILDKVLEANSSSFFKRKVLWLSSLLWFNFASFIKFDQWLKDLSSLEEITQLKAPPVIAVNSLQKKIKSLLHTTCESQEQRKKRQFGYIFGRGCIFVIMLLLHLSFLQWNPLHIFIIVISFRIMFIIIIYSNNVFKKKFCFFSSWWISLEEIRKTQ